MGSLRPSVRLGGSGMLTGRRRRRIACIGEAAGEVAQLDLEVRYVAVAVLGQLVEDDGPELGGEQGLEVLAVGGALQGKQVLSVERRHLPGGGRMREVDNGGLTVVPSHHVVMVSCC